jgi:hypothetical protein
MNYARRRVSIQFKLDVRHRRFLVEVRPGAEDPAFGGEVIGAIALELELFERGRFLETAAASLAGAHEPLL